MAEVYEFDMGKPEPSEGNHEESSKLSNQDLSDARAMGWVPKEDFRGDEAKWIDAETFLQRGRELTPILRENNKKLLKELREARSEIDNLKLTVQESREMFQNVADNAYKKAMGDIKKQIREAQREGDFELQDQLQEQYDSLEEQSKKPLTKSAGQPDITGQAQAQQRWNGIVSDWQDQNKWYGQDKVMTRQMDAIAKEIASQRPHLMGDSRLLDMAVEQLKEEMPEKFSNSRRSSGSPVSGSSESSSSGSRSGKKSVSDLPSDARIIGERQVKSGLWKDMSEYAAAYWSQF